MKTTIQNLVYAIAGSLLLASPVTMAASLTDRFDPYVLYNEIETTPAGPVDRLADRFAPYVLHNEIVTAKSCSDPVHELIADDNDPFITIAAINMARSSKPC
ncbi:MAG: hypothetical protein ABFS08_05005 [Pseudomonadota bacterium]